jgi:hypothetical protein
MLSSLHSRSFQARASPSRAEEMPDLINQSRRNTAPEPLRLLRVAVRSSRLARLLQIEPLPHPHMIHALLLPDPHPFVDFEAVAAPELLQADLGVDQHEAVPSEVLVVFETEIVNAEMLFQFFSEGCGGVFRNDVRVVVGHGEGGVDEEFGDAEFAEVLQDGEAAEGDERLAAVVDEGGGFFAGEGGAVHVAVVVEGVGGGVGRRNQTDGADGKLGAGALLAQWMAAFRHRLDVAGDRGVGGPSVAPTVVEVDFVYERDALLVDEDSFADGHGVDEALGDGLGGIGCIVLRLLSRRAGCVVESKALAERQDEVDEVRVGGNHRCEKIGLSGRR